MPENTETFKNLRVVRTNLLVDYLENTRIWCEIGNEAFAKHVLSTSKLSETKFSKDDSYRLYHSWRPEIMELTKDQAVKIKQFMNGVNTSDLTPEMKQWMAAFSNAGWLADIPADINLLVERALNMIIAIQNRYEITEYLKIIQRKKPKVIVEIGTARGGMLYCFCQLATPDALLVSIDLPGAPNCGGQTDDERKFYSSFAGQRQELKFIPADSHLSSTKEKLKEILNGKKIDVLFIDGDHSCEGVKQDYKMYKEFVADDGLITFHDIKLYPDDWGKGNEVGVFWDEFSSEHSVTEIVDPDGVCKPERPDGVDPCWGIGILGKC